MTETHEIELRDEEQEALTQMITGQMPFMQEKGYRSYIYQNDHTNPTPAFLLNMLYQQIHNNRIGIMVAKNVKTGAEETLLVGIELREDGTEGAFPLALILGSEAYDTYAIPLGEGRYSDDISEDIEA